MKRLKTLLTALALAATAPFASAVEIVVPAYFYPSWMPSQNEWHQLTWAAQQGARVTAIMNPGNGPGTASNSDYVASVNEFRAAGGKVVGYVYTCYGVNHCTPEVPPTRSTAEVLADAQKYASWYSVDGVFLDEMATQPSALPFYQTVSNGLKAAHPGWQIVGNPGVTPAAGYTALANTLMSFEGSYADFVNGPFLSGLTNAASTGAIVHTVATAAQMQEVMGLAKQHGLGAIYITDGTMASGNPYLHLPGYWGAEVAAAAVPEPASAVLLLAGLSLVGVARRRRTVLRETSC
ncbi:MAG: spherulation-specific family 4 protein [Burkholderiales bacterium]|nr:spherulation-specific family 4 protein [Burkholderiales bacterium]